MAFREPVSRHVRRQLQPENDELREFGRQHLDHSDELIRIGIVKEVHLPQLRQLRATDIQAAVAQRVQNFFRSPADPEPRA
jgi:glucose-6-phosphate-specific signal transduction histidine kinase